MRLVPNFVRRFVVKYATKFVQKHGLPIVNFLSRYRLGRWTMRQIIMFLWLAFPRGRAGITEFITGLLGLTFGGFGMTASQIAELMRNAVTEHSRVLDPAIPAPTYAAPAEYWERMSTGLEKLADGITTMYGISDVPSAANPLTWALLMDAAMEYDEIAAEQAAAAGP